MRRIEDFVAANPAFECPTQFCIAGSLGRSLVCFENYYDQIFRDAEVDVDLHLFAFDAAGTQVGALALRLVAGESVQVPSSDLGMRESGLVAVAALPRFDLRRLAGTRLRLRRRVGTGFYIIWEDAAGHLDTMHEWLPASPTPLSAQRFYVVFDHSGGRIARYGLIFMNPVLDRSAGARAQLGVYTASGRRLADAHLPCVPAMGSRIVYLDELFPDFPRWLKQEASLGAVIDGRNLVEPFSLEIQASGDFHLHHSN